MSVDPSCLHDNNWKKQRHNLKNLNSDFLLLYLYLFPFATHLSCVYLEKYIILQSVFKKVISKSHSLLVKFRRVLLLLFYGYCNECLYILGY